MNARGEVGARILIAVLAGIMGSNALDEHSVWRMCAVFALGYLFGMAPTISQWIEGDREGRDNLPDGDHQ